MRSLLFSPLLLASVATTVHGQVGDAIELDRSKPPGHWRIPQAPVRTPEESMKLFDLPSDFRVELVAAEPLVQDPIAIQFDERGRLWVLEWPSYNRHLRGVFPGLENLSPPKSNVVILEDTNGDGRMDKRTVFLTDFDWPRGLQVSKDGALVTKLPEIVAAHDTNNDGKSDREDVLANDLEVPQNPHGAQSNLFLAMDNWVYGSRNPKRMRLVDGTWKFEPSLNNRGQWGFTQDNYGRFVYASNGDHLRGDFVPGHYYTRNPNYPVMAGVDVVLPKDQVVWPQGPTPGVNRRAHLREEDGSLRVFTSNTAPHVYRGDQFPAEYVGNVFLGEVAGRFIRRSILTEKEGLITAENAYESQKREFLFSRDERFRPTWTATGPDGALYVADMYRGIIEGHLFITSFLRNQIIERGLEKSMLGMGRIYRIVHNGQPLKRGPNIARNNIAGWVDVLGHPSGFWRDTAQRMLVESGDARVVPAVRRVAREHASELARLHALWTLEGLKSLNPEVLTPALADKSPYVRQAAVRLSEPFLGSTDFLARVTALTTDDRIEVRRQLLFTLGGSKAPAAEQAMVKILARDIDQPITVEAALSGLNNREWAFLAPLLKDPAWSQERPGTIKLFGAIAHAVTNSEREQDLDRLLAEISDAAARPMWARKAVLDGLVAARKKGMSKLPASFAALEKSSDATFRDTSVALGKAWLTPLPPPVVANPDAPRRQANPGFDKGQGLFAICAACHGAEGQGTPALAPPLATSPIVASSTEEVIRSVLNGRNQDRKNPNFADMPPLGGLPDSDIAALVTYVRTRWGGLTTPVTAADVRRVRGGPAAP